MAQQVHISLDTAVKLLKEFDGRVKGDSVHDFIDSCDMAMDSIADACKPVLYNIIKTKLTGKARSLTKYRQFNDWPALKLFLEDVFSERRSVSFWQMELNSCRQNKNEDVADYSNKIEKCLSQLIDASVIGKTAATSHEISILLRTQALNIFIQGSIEPIKYHLKARNPIDLETAIELARSEERELASYTNSKSQNKGSLELCNFCHKKGHIAKNCFSKQKSFVNWKGNSSGNSFQYKNQAMKHEPEFNSETYRNRPIKAEPRFYHVQEKTSDIFCNYCKFKGHKISECRKRIQNENLKSNSRNAGNEYLPAALGRPTAK